MDFCSSNSTAGALYGVCVSKEKPSTFLALTLPSWRRLNMTQHVATQTAIQSNQPLQMAVAKPQNWLNFSRLTSRSVFPQPHHKLVSRVFCILQEPSGLVDFY